MAATKPTGDLAVELGEQRRDARDPIRSHVGRMPRLVMEASARCELQFRDFLGVVNGLVDPPPSITLSRGALPKCGGSRRSDVPPRTANRVSRIAIASPSP
jgi:hypothetical protein